LPKRDKLTDRQKRQVAKSKQRHLNKKDLAIDLNDTSHLSDLIHNGLVMSRFGEQADIVNLEDKQHYRCYLRQNIGSLVPGDRVSFRCLTNQANDKIQGVIEAKQERKSLLQRPSLHQGLKAVVANIDQVFVVVAPLPDFSSILLDRYLAAIEDAGITIDIVINKSDMKDEIDKQQLQSQIAIYEKIGYRCTWISTKNNTGLESLKQKMVAHQSILVGQSGVGKSSIINCLFPNQMSRVNQVSENSRLGQHTTTTSQLFLFESEPGYIIDSPGIREFRLSHMEQAQICSGFIEFRPYLGGCKFRDCKHLNEKGCQIIDAVNKDKINKQRWLNYKQIIESQNKQ
jgi:ribosome biogenesis GTPase